MSTAKIGSSRIGWHFGIASCIAIRAAVLNAASELSTE